VPGGPARLTLVPVTLAKGLEFDHVVLLEPGQIAAGEAYGLRRLYVALTRAVSRLTVFHAEPLPAELSLRTMRPGPHFRPSPAEPRYLGSVLSGMSARHGAHRHLGALRVPRCGGILGRCARAGTGKLRSVTRWCSVEAKGNHATAAVYLDKLAEELTNRGLEAWLMAPPGRVPSVYITNPGARALEENVCVERGKDGLWWFWWSWAERISMADDLDAAAAAITRVLKL
jgi:hypothetical protein